MKKFIRNHVNSTPIVDTVFTVVNMANKAKAEFGEENVIDATIGTLCDEQGQLVTFQSVYKHYNEMSDRLKAKYSASFVGNPDYREGVYNWVTQDIKLDLAHSVIATPGGSGAISTTIVDVLDEGETLVIPEIAWGSYKLMAQMNNLETETYSLFDGTKFNLENFKEVCSNVMEKQGKLLVIINDPCQNPTGYSLSVNEWEQVVEYLNDCSKQGPVILLNDIAYIDYAHDFKQSRAYLETFNKINKNVLIVIAFSMSKSFTSYGMRCGAAIILAQDAEAVREVEIVVEKSARATWSNIPNGAMEAFVYATTVGLNEYNAEREEYLELLKKRSNLFIKEADEVGLKYYPYCEGFFVTLEVEDAQTLNAYHETLMKNNIFTVVVTKGIRVAVCSTSLEKIEGLAGRMKTILEQVSN